MYPYPTMGDMTAQQLAVSDPMLAHSIYSKKAAAYQKQSIASAGAKRGIAGGTVVIGLGIIGIMWYLAKNA